MSAADSEESRWPDFATASIETQSMRSTVAHRSSSAMEGRFGFHGKPPSPELAQEAWEELEALYEKQTAALQGSTGEES